MHAHHDSIPEISVVIPVFNSQTTAIELCERLDRALRDLNISFEVVLVDDGSRDRSAEILANESVRRENFRLVRLIRNFGQHAAITAGLSISRGRWVVLMDDDLQNPPEEIRKLYETANTGFDVVCGAREIRKDSILRRIASSFAHKLMQRLFTGQTSDSISSFRIMSRRVVSEYLRLKEHHTYVAALISWLGFPQTSIIVRHDSRSHGRSNYTFIKLWSVWLNIALGFSERPLRAATWTGIGFSFIAFLVAGRAVYIYSTADQPLMGYTSLFAGQMLVSGVIMVFLGIIGEYVARVYREVKNRPFFIIDEVNSVPTLRHER